MSLAIPAESVTGTTLLGPEEVCELIPGMTTAKLSQLRFKGEGPPYYKPTAKTVVYDRDECMVWLRSTARIGTAEAV
ncbi:MULTISPECIES: hypothetical protein [unclassified Leucobacter]|uniref:hypothetical protein n=1 Tax=unclassified Leucobacter TaxID=2621730 RepID=UPI0030162BB4